MKHARNQRTKMKDNETRKDKGRERAMVKLFGFVCLGPADTAPTHGQPFIDVDSTADDGTASKGLANAAKQYYLLPA
jgi:hypothetical protein